MIRGHIGGIFALLAVAGCSRTSAPTPTGFSTATPPPAIATAPTPALSVALDPIASFDSCVLAHRGILLDLGDPGTRARFDSHTAASNLESIEREGATWARVRGKSVALTFFSTGPGDGDDPAHAGEPTYVEARMRGGVARSVSVYLNGKPVGLLPLSKGEVKTVSVRAPSSLLVPGTNEFSMRFNAPRSAGDVLAEIDWVHIGAGEPDAAYSAPTRADVLTNATFGGTAKQALSLRAPGLVRCSGWLPAGGSAEVYAGISGAGDADIELRLLRDRSAPAVLQRLHVVGGDPAGWAHATALLGDLGATHGTLGALEIAVVRATKGTRVLLGEPRVTAPLPAAAAPIAPSRGVVLVVLGDVRPRSLKLYGGALETPAMTELANAGIVFEAHRSSSTLPNGVLSAMLTGRTARANAINDGDSRLPKGVTTIADTARQAGIVTAMFTANPMTGPAFGFQRSWETFSAHTPLDEGPATSIFDEASRWIEAHKTERFLVVIHARGGHPPWDATTEDLKTVAPANYAGGLDPKHAAELLGKARHVPPTLRFTDQDRARAWALYALAMTSHDAAIGKLVGAMRGAGRDADSTIIVTGDVGASEGAHVPFGDGEPPDDELLSVPLVVRSAGHALAGTRVSLPTGDLDVARTVMSALGLNPSTYFQGVDLFRTAGGYFPPAARPLMATAGNHFSLRWGALVWSGTSKREQLCDVLLEPSCVTDVRATYPLTIECLERAAFDITRLDTPTDVHREPATIDASTSAAMRAWGR
ncbi:MAG: sulfatase-like hydrolase/transferase [Polyangiaceae bacterium]